MTEPLAAASHDLAQLLAGGEAMADDPSAAILAFAQVLRDLGHDDASRDRVLAAILLASGAERAFVVAQPSDADDWQVIASRNFDGESILNPADKLVRPLLNRCRQRREGYLTRDLMSESIAASLEREHQPRTRSLLILPIADSDFLLYLDHRFQEFEFGFGQLATAFTILVAQQAEIVHQQQLGMLQTKLKEARQDARSGRTRFAVKDSTPTRTPRTESRGVDGEFGDIIGEHPDLIEVLHLIARVAPTVAPILINGESGTGKELVALAVHKNSDRATQPFVSENCAALAENLLEAELFGVVKGAFTGASADRPGLFEQASGGTLFLDEIGDTSPGMQKKLLRAIQEGVIRRVGGQEAIAVDVRIISATHRDLFAAVQEGSFREDLFYRLNVINLALPPLRERREDVPLLVHHFVDELNRQSGEKKEPTTKLMSALISYHWPGNIRELQNEVRRVYALGGEFLQADDLSPHLSEDPVIGDSPLDLDAILARGSLKAAQEAWERQMLVQSLDRFAGNKARVSAALNVPKTTLYAKLRRYGLLEDEPRTSK